MIGNFGSLKGQRGFSFAELVIALALFVSSVLGVSVMITSGHSNVIRGAKELAASDLASKKIEEVKSLPFYKSNDGTNKDIDDFYWAYNGGTPRANSDQFTNPTVENYGTIPGFPSYKRTTAVKYQVVNGGSLADAFMDPTWVPKGVTGTQTDRPTGGPSGGPYTQLHAILVQVKVYYFQDGLEKSYTGQGLAGDLMVTGGTNSPPMVINSISPTYGYYQADTNLAMTIYVTAQGLNAGSQLDAFLWYAGAADVHCTGSTATANAAGTQITCHFDLRSANGVRPGLYNLCVYWRDEGWKAMYRDGIFEVRAQPPGLTSIANQNWGHQGEAVRQVTITGTALWDATVTMSGPSPANTYNITGLVQSVSGDGTSLVANFDLRLQGGVQASRPANSRWNFAIHTPGGDVNTLAWGDGQRFWMNPPPVITRVVKVGQSAPFTADYGQVAWGYRAQTTKYFQVEGSYLYGMDTNDGDTGTTCLKYSSYQTANATWDANCDGARESNGCNSSTSLRIKYNPSSSLAGGGVNHTLDSTRWQVSVTNYGGTATSNIADWNQLVFMNPAPTISSQSGFTPGGGLKTGSASGQGSNTYTGLSVTGGYLQSSQQIEFVRSATLPTPTNTTYLDVSGAGGNPTGDGSSGMSMSGLSLNVTVGNSMNFKVWPGATQAADTAITDSGSPGNGSYYIEVINPDGQAVVYGPVTINHAQYTCNSSAKQNWGTVTGGGTYWQDRPITLTATPGTTLNASGIQFVAWQVGGVDVSVLTPVNLMATGNYTYVGRFRKYFYNNGTNYGAFSQTQGGSTNLSTGDSGYTTMYLQAHGGLFSSTKASLATAGTTNFTGATQVVIHWRQTSSSAIDNIWTLHLSTNRTGDYNDGGRIAYHNGQQSSYNNEVIPITGSSYTGHYVHVSTYGAAPWSNVDCYVHYIYSE